ncbi:MAG: nitrous oxide-stimulated promoter family protein [Elusimicrobiota bacterium]
MEREASAVDVDKRTQEYGTLERFVTVFCREKHAPRELLCAECRSLLAYATDRLEKCPYLVKGEPKPKCKDCPIHCYAPARRAQVREVMRFSGMHFVKRGRLDRLLRYFLGF